MVDVTRVLTFFQTKQKIGAVLFLLLNTEHSHSILSILFSHIPESNVTLGSVGVIRELVLALSCFHCRRASTTFTFNPQAIDALGTEMTMKMPLFSPRRCRLA
jgi:hypothetical protein